MQAAAGERESPASGAQGAQEGFPFCTLVQFSIVLCFYSHTIQSTYCTSKVPKSSASTCQSLQPGNKRRPSSHSHEPFLSRFFLPPQPASHSSSCSPTHIFSLLLSHCFHNRHMKFCCCGYTRIHLPNRTWKRGCIYHLIHSICCCILFLSALAHRA